MITTFRVSASQPPLVHPAVRPNLIVWLSWLVALLAAIAAGAGLFWPGEGGTYRVTSVHGESIEMFGRGLYRYDTLFSAAGFRGQDVVTLVFAIPLLIVFTLLYRRGSLRGHLLLTGTLAYFCYVYANMALGAAYNRLFLVYVASFSAGLFALVLSARAIDLQRLPRHCSPRLPRRGAAGFMFASALVLVGVWVGMGGLLRSRTPDVLDSYTTLVTFALDLAIILPALVISGVLVLHRDPMGYLLAFPLLCTVIFLVPGIIAMTVSQLWAGVSFSPGQIIGPIAGFLVLGAAAVWLLVALLRNIADTATSL